jgi:hypothetical protein
MSFRTRVAAANMNDPLATFTPRYSPAHSFIDVPEPYAMQAPYIVRCKLLINPSFVDCSVGRGEQRFGYPTLEFSDSRDAEPIA